jgi:predicted RNA-binding Zn-ribbon protein involved in translation (DUF1610 family)
MCQHEKNWRPETWGCDCQAALRCPRCGDEQLWTITTPRTVQAWRCGECGWEPTEN